MRNLPDSSPRDNSAEKPKPVIELAVLINGVVWGVRIIRDPDDIRCTSVDHRERLIDLHPFTCAFDLAKALDRIREGSAT